MSELKKETDTQKKKVKKNEDFNEDFVEGNEEELVHIVHDIVPDSKPIIKSNKELYESYIKELKKFSLTLNGEVIYDSSIDKSKYSPLSFEDDYFVLYGKKYSYNGLRIQKLNIR